MHLDDCALIVRETEVMRMVEMTQHEKDLKAIAEFKLFDDTFMSAVFDGQIAETELLIRVVLGRDDIEVISSKAQYYITNIYGHEVRLDILAKDKEGKYYHFEVQRSKAGASVRRARFTAALVDGRLLGKGKPYDDMPDRYTIFITEADMFGRGIPSYHAENKITELENRPLGDGGNIIYVNGQYRNVETPIGQLMHDFSCVDASEIINPLLRERVHYLKETERGREEMCQIMENRINEEKIELAKKAIARGKLSLEEIAETLSLPLAFVQELARPKAVMA